MQEWPALRARCAVYEDERVLALDKPAGISVTGERHDTDLVELAEEAGEALHPVHRIDKVTSGLVLLAKDLEAHGPLTRQFAERTAGKAYLAVVRGIGLPPSGTVDLPLAEGRKGRVRIAAPREEIRFDPAIDRWVVPERALLAGKRRYPASTDLGRVWEGGAGDQARTVLVCRPRTGRRHQLRVHLAWIGYEIDGDPLFVRDGGPDRRCCLHAWRLAVDLPWAGGRRLDLRADPPDDLWATLPAGAPGAAELLAEAASTERTLAAG